MRELTPDDHGRGPGADGDHAGPADAGVMEAAVKHLHAFAREVNLTPGEWIKGIALQTAVGKMCTAERQEFVLLSDTLGLSALVNGLHDETAIEEGTHEPARPVLPRGLAEARSGQPDRQDREAGQRMRCSTAGDRRQRKAARQCHRLGLADRRRRPHDIQEQGAAIDYRGVFTTDADGVYELRTVKPIGYSIPMDGPVGEMVARAEAARHATAHIHFLVGAPGYRELVTALYLRDDPHLADERRVRLVG